MPSYFRLEGISFIGESIARFEDYHFGNQIQFLFILLFEEIFCFSFKYNLLQSVF